MSEETRRINPPKMHETIDRALEQAARIGKIGVVHVETGQWTHKSEPPIGNDATTFALDCPSCGFFMRFPDVPATWCPMCGQEIPLTTSNSADSEPMPLHVVVAKVVRDFTGGLMPSEDDIEQLRRSFLAPAQ